MKKISSAVLAVLLPVLIFFIAGMACYSYELTREAVKTSAETAQAKLLEQAAVAEDIAQNINRIRASVDQSVNDLQLVAKASTNLGSV